MQHVNIYQAKTQLSKPQEQHAAADPAAMRSCGLIARFLDRLARPFVVRSSLADAYAEMASDQQREAEADTWIEGPFRRLPQVPW